MPLVGEKYTIKVVEKITSTTPIYLRASPIPLLSTTRTVRVIDKTTTVESVSLTRSPNTALATIAITVTIINTKTETTTTPTPNGDLTTTKTTETRPRATTKAMTMPVGRLPPCETDDLFLCAERFLGADWFKEKDAVEIHTEYWIGSAEEYDVKERVEAGQQMMKIKEEAFGEQVREMKEEVVEEEVMEVQEEELVGKPNVKGVDSEQEDEEDEAVEEVEERQDGRGRANAADKIWSDPASEGDGSARGTESSTKDASIIDYPDFTTCAASASDSPIVPQPTTAWPKRSLNEANDSPHKRHKAGDEVLKVSSGRSLS